MPTHVQLDFIGMCLVMRDFEERAGRLTIGFLKDPTHIHMLLFDAADQASTTALLRSHETLGGCIEAPDTVVNDEGRLPSLTTLTSEMPNRDKIDDALGASIKLPHGTFDALAPVLSLAEGPWLFGETEGKLTDRCQFTCQTGQSSVSLGEHQMHPGRDGAIRAVVVAIDHDIGTRPRRLTLGFKLEEFQLFYRCTTANGPIPVYNQPLLNPDNPICPAARVNFYRAP